VKVNWPFAICPLRRALPLRGTRPHLSPARGARRGASVWLLAIGCWPLRGRSADEIPPLAPLLPEIPPTFWEQYGLLVSAAALLLMAALAIAMWLALRPKPLPPVPPEVRVRAELEALRGEPETGAVLSHVSQSLRRYLVAAFALPPEELTTTEFCARLSANEIVGAELATVISHFLRECDERKFSPAPAPVPLNAVPRALDLVAQAEARRREPRASVLECGGPPPLLPGADEVPKSQRAGAVRNAGATARPPTT